VIVTPRLVHPLEPDEVPPLPPLPKKFLQAPTGDESGPADGPDVSPATDRLR
jgi:hypothetical protein